MIAVVSTDHRGLRIVDLFDDDEIAVAQAQVTERVAQGYAVASYDAADLRDLASVVPDRLQTRVA